MNQAILEKCGYVFLEEDEYIEGYGEDDYIYLEEDEFIEGFEDSTASEPILTALDINKYFKASYVKKDIKNSILTVKHNLNSKFCMVTVYLNGLLIIPDAVTLSTDNIVKIDIRSFGDIYKGDEIQIIVMG